MCWSGNGWTSPQLQNIAATAMHFCLKETAPGRLRDLMSFTRLLGIASKVRNCYIWIRRSIVKMKKNLSLLITFFTKSSRNFV